MSVATLGYGRTNALYGRQRNTSVVSTNGSCSIVKGWKSKGSDSSRPRALQVRNGHDQFFIVKSLASSMQLSEFGFVDSVALRFDSWLNKQSQGGADCKRNTRSNNKGLRILNSAKCGRRAAYELNEVDKNINSSVEPFIVEVEPVAVFNSKELFVARDLFHFESLVAVVVEKADSLVEPESCGFGLAGCSWRVGDVGFGNLNSTTRQVSQPSRLLPIIRNALRHTADSCYAFPVTSKKGVIGIGVPIVAAAKSRNSASDCGFHFCGPVYGGPNVGPQGHLHTASAATQVRQPVRAAASIGVDTAVSQLSLLEAIMANSLTPFNFGQSTIRTTTIGEAVWFVCTDVAEALGYRNAPDASRHLDEDEKGTQIVRTLGGDQTLTIINESGLYTLVLRSRKPEARKFAKWVTGEVLPAIRKSGGYSNTPAQKVSEHEVLFTFICELIDSGRFGFDQIAGIAHKSNGRLLQMVDQAVISDKVRAIRSQIHGLNLAELHQVAELSGSLAMCEAAVIRKNGKTSEQLMEERK